MQNFNLEKELAEQSEKDWKFGALSQPGIVSIPEAERINWLPQGQLQYDQYGDFENCATRSPVSHLKALLTYHFHHTMMPANQQWFRDKGFVVIRNGKEVIELSHRFNSILDGTTKSGNSLKAPLESLRTDGVIPMAMLPQEDWMKWEDFYNPGAITQAMRELGQDFLARFTINYEQVALAHFADVLQDDMIGVAGYAWPQPINGVYPRTDGDFNHAVLLFDLPQWQIFDNYEDFDGRQKVPADFTKALAPDYIFFDYGYRVFISGEVDVKKKIFDLQTIVALLLKLIGLEGLLKAIPPPPAAIPAPAPKPIPEAPQPQPAPVKHPTGYAEGSLDDRARMCHLAATICDDLFMAHGLKEDLLRTIAGESGFNQWAENHGNHDGTADYGISQFNTGKNRHGVPYWIGPGAAFKDITEVLENPAKCVRVMAYEFMHGHPDNWDAYASRNTPSHGSMVAMLRAHYLTLGAPVTSPGF